MPYVLLRTVAAWYLLVCYTAIPAQDLVVRTEGDSLNCRIRSVDRHGLRYVHVLKGRLEHVYLPLSDVRHWERGYYTAGYRAGRTVRDFRGFPYFRSALQGGLARFSGAEVGLLPTWAQDHEERLRNGKAFAMEMHYLPIEHLGVGFQASVTNAHARTEDVEFLFNDGTVLSGVVEDNVEVIFIGPSVAYFRGKQEQGFHWNLSGAVGLFKYRDRAIVLEPLDLYGNSTGVRLAGGAEYRMRSGVGLGLSAAKTITTLSNLHLDGDPVGYELLGSTRMGLGAWYLALSLSYAY